MFFSIFSTLRNNFKRTSRKIFIVFRCHRGFCDTYPNCLRYVPDIRSSHYSTGTVWSPPTFLTALVSSNTRAFCSYRPSFNRFNFFLFKDTTNKTLKFSNSLSLRTLINEKNQWDRWCNSKVLRSSTKCENRILFWDPTTLNTKSVCWSQHTITNWKNYIFLLAARCVRRNFGKKEKCRASWIKREAILFQALIFGSFYVRESPCRAVSCVDKAYTHSLIHSPPQYVPVNLSDSMPIESRTLLVRILICFWRIFLPNNFFSIYKCVGRGLRFDQFICWAGASSVGLWNYSLAPSVFRERKKTSSHGQKFPIRPAYLIYIFINTHICAHFFLLQLLKLFYWNNKKIIKHQSERIFFK